MKLSVSVIIPTYQRPDYLRETIESVWEQTVLPDEIIIGDDSPGDESEEMVNRLLIPQSPIPIRYFHHKPSLKEVANVDFQYAQVNSDCILHLHDDDPIYPRCNELLKAALESHPECVASFGLQRIIREDGSLVADSEGVNKFFFRTPDRAGVVDGFTAGAISMFPNNGFMVRTQAARSIGYSDQGRAGLATDFYFGFRLGQLRKSFYLVNDFTAKVRITGQSQSRVAGSDNAYRQIKILLADLKPNDFTPEVEQVLQRTMPLAITTAALKKERRQALQWLFSRYYRHHILTPRGIKRLLLILKP